MSQTRTSRRGARGVKKKYQKINSKTTNWELGKFEIEENTGLITCNLPNKQGHNLRNEANAQRVRENSFTQKVEQQRDLDRNKFDINKNTGHNEHVFLLHNSGYENNIKEPSVQEFFRQARENRVHGNVEHNPFNEVRLNMYEERRLKRPLISTSCSPNSAPLMTRNLSTSDNNTNSISKPPIHTKNPIFVRDLMHRFSSILPPSPLLEQPQILVDHNKEEFQNETYAQANESMDKGNAPSIKRTQQGDYSLPKSNELRSQKTKLMPDKNTNNDGKDRNANDRNHHSKYNKYSESAPMFPPHSEARVELKYPFSLYERRSKHTEQQANTIKPSLGSILFSQIEDFETNNERISSYNAQLKINNYSIKERKPLKKCRQQFGNQSSPIFVKENDNNVEIKFRPPEFSQQNVQRDLKFDSNKNSNKIQNKEFQDEAPSIPTEVLNSRSPGCISKIQKNSYVSHTNSTIVQVTDPNSSSHLRPAHSVELPKSAAGTISNNGNILQTIKKEAPDQCFTHSHHANRKESNVQNFGILKEQLQKTVDIKCEIDIKSNSSEVDFNPKNKSIGLLYPDQHPELESLRSPSLQKRLYQDQSTTESSNILEENSETLNKPLVENNLKKENNDSSNPKKINYEKMKKRHNILVSLGFKGHPMFIAENTNNEENNKKSLLNNSSPTHSTIPNKSESSFTDTPPNKASNFDNSQSKNRKETHTQVDSSTKINVLEKSRNPLGEMSHHNAGSVKHKEIHVPYPSPPLNSPVSSGGKVAGGNFTLNIQRRISDTQARVPYTSTPVKSPVSSGGKAAAGNHTFNIQRRISDPRERVPTRTETIQRLEQEYAVDAAEYLAKEKEKAAKKKEQWLAKYSYVDQGHRLTEGYLDEAAGGFDPNVADVEILASEEEVRRRQQEEVRRRQQEELRRDALVFQEKERKKQEEREKREEEKKKKEMERYKHVSLGNRLGSGNNSSGKERAISSLVEAEEDHKIQLKREPEYNQSLPKESTDVCDGNKRKHNPQTFADLGPLSKMEEEPSISDISCRFAKFLESRKSGSKDEEEMRLLLLAQIRSALSTTSVPSIQSSTSGTQERGNTTSHTVVSMKMDESVQRPVPKSQQSGPAIASNSSSRNGSTSTEKPVSQQIASSSGALLVIRSTQEALDKTVSQLLAAQDLDKHGASSLYKPLVEQPPQYAHNGFEFKQFRSKFQSKNGEAASSSSEPIVPSSQVTNTNPQCSVRNIPGQDFFKSNGAIPKHKPPPNINKTNPTPAEEQEITEAQLREEMRAARLRMQQMYNESLTKQENA